MDIMSKVYSVGVNMEHMRYFPLPTINVGYIAAVLQHVGTCL